MTPQEMHQLIEDEAAEFMNVLHITYVKRINSATNELQRYLIREGYTLAIQTINKENYHDNTPKQTTLR